MTFFHPVELSAAVHISIYIIYNGEDLLRQKLLCTDQYCEISKDSYSLTIQLLNTTFNIPNAKYYVVIDDKFLRYKNESEPIPGIRPRKWVIRTEGL